MERGGVTIEDGRRCFVDGQAAVQIGEVRLGERVSIGGIQLGKGYQKVQKEGMLSMVVEEVARVEEFRGP